MNKKSILSINGLRQIHAFGHCFLAGLFCLSILGFWTTLSPAKQSYPFKANIDLLQNTFQCHFKLGDQGIISIQIVQESNQDFRINVNIDHLKVPDLDLSTHLEGVVQIQNDNTNSVPSLMGRIASQYSLINYKPVEELSGSFEIKEKILFLNAVSMGGVTCQGYIELVSPYKVNLSIDLKSVDLGNVLLFTSQNNQDTYDVTGNVSGQIKVSGTFDNFQLSGQLESYDGNLGDLKYDNMSLNFDGLYPNILLSNSSISKTDGLTFNLEGILDLSHQDNFEKQIADLTKSPIVSENDINREWTLKRTKSKDASRTTELKYLLKKQDPTGRPLKEDADNMLGIERSVEF